MRRRGREELDRRYFYSSDYGRLRRVFRCQNDPLRGQIVLQSACAHRWVNNRPPTEGGLTPFAPGEAQPSRLSPAPSIP
jgi:hypothetical protein